MSRYELYTIDQLLELVRNGRADVSAKAASEIKARFAKLNSRPTPRAVDGGQAGENNGQVALPTATNA